MKTVFKLGEVSVGEVKINGIDMEFECTAKDFMELFEAGKLEGLKIIKDLPKLTEEFKNNMNEATRIAQDDLKEDKINIFKDRKDIIKIKTLLDKAREQINACNRNQDMSCLDVAERFLMQSEEMYFGLKSTTAQYIEDDMLELYDKLENLK